MPETVLDQSKEQSVISSSKPEEEDAFHLASFPTVDSIFNALGEKFELKPRASQLELARMTNSTFSSKGVACIEAPTGTGKTLGYLAGALEAQAHSAEPLPIVISTATVSLQSQIMKYDIPRLVDIGVLKPHQAAVAKGRGRYFCPRMAEMLEKGERPDSQMDMFGEEKEIASAKGVEISLDMLSSWRDKSWDGDRDSWEGEIPDCWTSYCQASSETCINRACPHMEECPYMRSRAQLSKAKLIIANHDMVLADLSTRAESSPSNALPIGAYSLVVDEAHHLAEKAIDIQRASVDLSDIKWLDDLAVFYERARTFPEVEKALSMGDTRRLDIRSHLIIQEVSSLNKALKDGVSFNSQGVFSWGLNSVEGNYKLPAKQATELLASMILDLERIVKNLSDKSQKVMGMERSVTVGLLVETYFFLKQAQQMHKGIHNFYKDDVLVRWVLEHKDTQRLTICSQPLEGSEELTRLLWDSKIPSVLVSATLQIAGSFDRFRATTGLPESATVKALPPVFDYSRGMFHSPRMENEPGSYGYEAELVDKITRLYDRAVGPGMLVLFTSRESMIRVANRMPEHFRSALLVQGSMPVPELIKTHMKRIDDGNRSVLFGLNSMSEGLDLPGGYCSHLIITRLPFNVPGDPVEEARRLLMGDSAWFEQAYLADMLTKLIQSSGRLIRRETDHGVITILDGRLRTKRYGRLAYRSLPDFTFQQQLKKYFEMAKERNFDMSYGKDNLELDIVEDIPETPDLTDSVDVPMFTVDMSLVANYPTGLASSTPKAVAPASKIEEKAELAKERAPLNKPRNQSLSTASSEAISELYIVSDKSARDVIDGLLEEMDVNSSDQLKTVGSKVDGSVLEVLGSLVKPKGASPRLHEVQYLAPELNNPGLPLGSPFSEWYDHQLPQATLLAILFENDRSWDLREPEWKQLMRLRPDLIQAAEVLRSHHQKEDHVLKNHLSEIECHRALRIGFAGIGNPKMSDVIGFLAELENKVIQILEGSFSLPQPQHLALMPQAALDLCSSFRSKLKIG